jgi:hypothetical protein
LQVSLVYGVRPDQYSIMNSGYSAVELWFARFCVILGAKELVDALSNIGVFLRMRSGLNITLPTVASEPLVIAYTVFSACAGVYLASRGALFSRLAFKRGVSRAALLADFTLPAGNGVLAVALLGFGASEFVAGLMELVRHGVTQVTFASQPVGSEHRTAVYFALGLQHLLIGTALLYGGEMLAGLFLGKTASRSIAPPADRPPRQF